MTIFFALLFPIGMALFLIVFFMGLGKSMNHAIARAQKQIDPRLPHESLNRDWEAHQLKVHVNYLPRRLSGKKMLPPSLRLKVALPFGSSLFLSPELKGDRFLKRVGLSQETEIGDLELDHHFHMVAENGQKAAAWMRTPTVREILIEFTANPYFEFFEIRPEGCMLYYSNLVLAAGADFEGYINTLATQVALLALQAQVELKNQQAMPATKFSRRFDFYEDRWTHAAIKIAFLIASLAIYGTLFASLVLQLLCPGASIVIAEAANVILLFIFVILLRPAIRKVQLPSKAFFSFFSLIAVFILLGSTPFELFANRALDSNSPLNISCEITQKRKTYKKGSYSYRIEVHCPSIEAPLGDPGSIEIGVTPQAFEAVVAGHTVAVLKTYPGLFHFPWYESYALKF